MNTTRLGFIGLGVMGAPMCRNLLRRSGAPLTVFDVADHAMGPLVDEGARAASAPVGVASESDIIFLSLPDGLQVESVVLGQLRDHLRTGQTVVDMSTSPVSLVRRIADELSQRGVTFVDAPVARTRQAARDGTLSVSAGAADKSTFEQVEPFLRCMATDITYCGPVGSGALVKLLNNLVVFETVVALAEALTLARRAGLVPDDLLLDVLGKGSAASFTLENHGKKALLPDEHPRNAFPARAMRKDLGYALDLAKAAGVQLPAAELAHGLLGRTCDLGYQDDYHTAVVRVIDTFQPKEEPNDGIPCP